MRALDHELFDEQFAQLTPREMRYALALHDLGPGAHRSDEIVAALERPSSKLDRRAVSRRPRISVAAHVELHRAPPPCATENGGTRPAKKAP